jgi:hypothetical protein
LLVCEVGVGENPGNSLLPHPILRVLRSSPTVDPTELTSREKKGGSPSSYMQ